MSEEGRLEFCYTSSCSAWVKPDILTEFWSFSQHKEDTRRQIAMPLVKENFPMTQGKVLFRGREIYLYI